MRVLVLDDDPLVAEGLQRALRREGYHVLVAHSAHEAVRLAGEEFLDLVICDVRMPEVDGLDALAMLHNLQQGMRSIVITGYASEDAPVRAIKRGVDDYLFKPVPLEDLLKSVRHSLALAQLERQGRQALEDLRERYLHLVIAVVSAFQNQDRYFFEHSRRVAAIAVDMGLEMGLSLAAVDRLELAAWLHDIGLLHIERELLQKAEQLTAEELDRLRSHPVLAGQLLEKVPDLRQIVPILRAHREHFDGTGTPAGLRGEEIPLESRILAVAEAFDSLTHARPHRPALEPEAALEVLRGQSGCQFDPAVVEVCCQLAQTQRTQTGPEQLMERERRSRSA
ncbi:MAG: HD domain-containing phosphohydrolase, partial [Candidatus Eremiobacterota bacterium]